MGEIAIQESIQAFIFPLGYFGKFQNQINIKINNATLVKFATFLVKNKLGIFLRKMKTFYNYKQIFILE